ncbi:MAG: chorismate synthase [Dehalococcoidales bacterium]|nr:chorismate synthase [Dehalococcoidales bacterium]MDP7415235.1 chorismate synthase [Dehalococcoidales bacterium]
MNNRLGRLFTVTSFGESHGRCVGVVINGCPAGLPLNEDDIQREVDKRKPGAGAAATTRVEEDKITVLSGIFHGVTTGAPVCCLVWNKDVDSSEYEKTRFQFRPSQADYTAFVKYGGFNDFRGGGRFSGRITVASVMAGAVAKKLLGLIGVEIMAHTVEIGGIKARPLTLDEIRKNVVENVLRCADSEVAGKMDRLIRKVREEGDSLGGIIEGIAVNVPVGLGEPSSDHLDGALAGALMSIPAVKGVEFGAGFAVAGKMGSENNDPFVLKNGKISTVTNNAGGVLGGISNGLPIVVRVAVKPTASIARSQPTVDIKEMKEVGLAVRGKHDVCIVPRAVAVVEAIMAVILADFALRVGMIPRVIK